MKSIFKQSVELNMKIEKFLSIISDSLLLFDKEISTYLLGNHSSFDETFKRISDLETEADKLEIDIKTSLYKYMLLPNTRADVLSLIKSLDDIIDATEEITKEFFIQKPIIPKALHNDFIDLTKHSISSAESLLHAARAFFNEVHLVSSYVNKINFYEHEADLVEDQINIKIFNNSITTDLAEKMQLKSFVCKIASISDQAEVIGEKLTIFEIKREI
jgi:predicted phosphate transport protein (TIGR00153 family)